MKNILSVLNEDNKHHIEYLRTLDFKVALTSAMPAEGIIATFTGLNSVHLVANLPSPMIGTF